MLDRSRAVGRVGTLVGVWLCLAAQVTLAQDVGAPPPPAPAVRNSESSEAPRSDPATQPGEPRRGFWASFAHSTPLGVSTRTSGEAGFWARTREGSGRIWSDGQSTLIVSAYAWHLPWKHKTERQKAFNDAAWGAGFGRTFAENDRRQRTLYVMANNDSHERMQYMMGYAWQARWQPHGTLRLGAGYTMFLIGRYEYNYVPVPLMLPAFSAGTDAVDVFATYVPYGEVILFVGRISF